MRLLRRYLDLRLLLRLLLRIEARPHVDMHIVRIDGLRPGIRLAELARHRLVYAALGAMMQTDIHALAIHAKAPDEAA